MRINTNIMAMNTKRQLGINNSNSSKTVEKLSSGLRINRAADDAAGLAISEKMRSQIRGLNQASRNAQDAISLVQTAEGALGTTHDILQKMRELAVQAANDTNVTVDRGQIQKEINQLTSEINRIGNTTEFNTMKLINGDRANGETISVGTGNVVTGVSNGSVGVNYALGVTLTGTNFISGSISISADTADDAIAWNKLGTTGGETNTITVSKDTNGGLSVVIETEDQDGNLVTASLVIDAATVAAATGDTYDVSFRGVNFTVDKASFTAAASGAGNTSVELNLTDAFAADGNAAGKSVSLSNDFDMTLSSGQATFTSGISVDGSDARLIGVKYVQVALNSAGTGLTVNFLADDGSGSDVSFATQNIDISSYTAKLSEATKKTVTAGTDNSLAFQVGANQGQAIQVAIKDMRAAALGISSTTASSSINVVSSEGDVKAVADAAYTTTKTVTKGTDNESIEYALDVTNHKKAAGAVTVFDNAIELVSDQRSALGAVQNRLEYTIKNLDIASENLSASESRIRDADMAAEIMTHTKNNILNQAATAMLAQANQAPQSVLQLLQ